MRRARHRHAYPGYPMNGIGGKRRRAFSDRVTTAPPSQRPGGRTPRPSRSLDTCYLLTHRVHLHRSHKAPVRPPYRHCVAPHRCSVDRVSLARSSTRSYSGRAHPASVVLPQQIRTLCRCSGDPLLASIDGERRRRSGHEDEPAGIAKRRQTASEWCSSTGANERMIDQRHNERTRAAPEAGAA